MTALALGDRLVLGILAGLAGFGVLAMVALQLHATVPALALPMALVAGVAWRWRAPAAAAGSTASRGLVWVLALVLAVAMAAVAFGALATPSRHWDGIVSWQVKAAHLTHAMTLEQPFFRDPHVFAHSRDYPLLQPLIVAAGDRLCGGGRALFPLLYAILALLVGVSLRRAGTGGAVAWLGAAACVLTPRLANPTSGAADSGYGELFLLVAVTAVAAGLLLADERLLATGCLLAVLVKPEGIAYAGIAVAVSWCRGDRRLLAAAAGGWLLGAALWLPVLQDLQSPGANEGMWLLLPLAGVAAAVSGIEVLARRLRLTTGARVSVSILLVPLLGLAMAVLAAMAGQESSAMGLYLGDVGRALRRLARLPGIVSGVLWYGLSPGGFALAFLAPILIGLVLLARRQRLPALSVAGLVLGGGGAVVAAFLLSPEEDLGHHLSSSMPRLLLHWIGPATLVTGVWADALSRTAGQGGERGATPATPGLAWPGGRSAGPERWV